jgi:PAS domain S-box-containing protein
MMQEQDIELIKRKLEREKKARQEAEKILELKALELYSANINLQKLNESLESKIRQRTNDLVKSKKIYQELVESVNEIVFEVDSFFNLTYINTAATNILLYSPEEFSKITFLQIVEDSHKERVKEFLITCLKENVAKGYLEFPAVKKNGELIWLGQNFQLDFREEDGKMRFNGLKAMARDITTIQKVQNELKLNDEKYRLILENMNLGFMEVNNEGIIQRVYQALCKMTGYTEEELIGQSANDIFIPEEFKETLFQQTQLRDKGGISSYEIQIIKKNGERLWVLVSGGPLLNDKREVVGSVGIHYDISNLKNIQSELAVAKEVAELAQKSEQEFLANMSHEIRTPLNAIIGMSHLMYDTKPTPEQVEFLDIIKNSASFLLTLISDILDITKIEAKKLEVKKMQFDLIGQLKTFQRTYELKTQAKDLKVILETDPNLDVLVLGDELIFNQVFNNLLSNAEKFTEKGHIKVSAKIESHIDEKNVLLAFEVEDTGLGMKPEHAESIFQKFKQVHSINNTKTKGTGLGLAIVKELVTLQGGTISLSTFPKQGTTFYVKMPFELTDIKIDKGNENTNSSGPIEFTDFKILIAEDNPLNFKYLSTLLKKWGIKFEYAKDGREAVNIAKGERFDLILMDIQMPNMDGYQASMSIRAEFGPNQKTPIVALTASAMIHEKNKAVNAEMNGVLIKPFTPDQLSDLLSKYLQKGNNIDSNNNLHLKNKPTMIDENVDREIDQNSLDNYFGDDADFKKVVFETFLDEIEENISQFKNQYEQQNWNDLGGTAHKMKPTFSMVGLPKTERLLKDIESEIKTNGINQETKDKVALFLAEVPNLINFVKIEFKKN